VSLPDVQVSLGGVQLAADHSQPASGGWLLTLRSITGWRSPASDGTEASPHWSGRGNVASSDREEGRQVVIEGLLLADSAQMLNEGLDVLGRLKRAPLVVAEGSRALVRTADVRMTQMQETKLTPTIAQVTLNLAADDPIRYSAESRTLTNGANLLPNRGDATAFGRLTLTAPHGAISITHPGGVWTFPALATGSRLIDFRELEVWNGNARVFGAAAGPAPRVLPGGSSWTVAGLSTGSAILTRAEAWS